ncbi:hypothetical protein Btru_005748 [Bulinus truncatus]|nr:hypothetical protein Btru_005748 [Bulinus truncatus]
MAVVRKDNTSETCANLSSISAELWVNDVNRFSDSDVTVNYQTQVPDGTTIDKSSQKFFTHINKAKLSTGTYKLLADLLDNYEPTRDNIEFVTTQESQEIDAFLDAILNTTVMDSLLKYFFCKGIVEDQSDLKSRLHKLWFELYPRSGKKTNLDTSGFEHVFAGEYKDSRFVGGLHNWLSFYLKENDGSLDYYGYINKSEPNSVGAAFSWSNRVKTLGSFFIGVSPEFDVAIYSLCFLTHRNKPCAVTLNGSFVTIMTMGKGHIDTAFVILNQSKDGKQKKKNGKLKKRKKVKSKKNLDNKNGKKSGQSNTG